MKIFIKFEFIVHYKADEVLHQKLVLLIEGENIPDFEIPQNILPKNKTPKEIQYIKSFPRTVSGKIIRKEIQL